MATSSMLHARGLQTYYNFLSSVPEGALFQADNVVIDRDGVIEPRRGIKVLEDLPTNANQLLTYKNTILANYGDAIAFFDPSTGFFPYKKRASFTSANVNVDPITPSNNTITINLHGLRNGDELLFLAGSLPSPLVAGTTYFAVDVTQNTFCVSTASSGSPITFTSTGSGTNTVVYNYVINSPGSMRIKGVELNGNFYVTSDNGIRKISKLDPYFIGKAGGIRALDLTAVIDYTSVSGFLESQREVSYRVTWITTDINGNLIEGFPSFSTTVYNAGQNGKNTILTFPVPADVTTDYSYRVYRTAQAAQGASGDEMKLVYENAATTTDILTNGFVTVNDQQPEALRNSGTNLYTNEFSGEGIAQANDIPPISQDVAIFKNVVFYANTTSNYFLDTNLLGLDGLGSFVASSVVSDTHGTKITIPGTPPLNVGDDVVIKGTTNMDGVTTIYSVTPSVSTTDVVVTKAFGTVGSGVVSLFTSYVTVVKNAASPVSNKYYFVGRRTTGTLRVTDNGSAVAGTYMDVNSANNLNPYRVWLNDTSADTPTIDPTVTGRISLRVDYVGTPQPATSTTAAIIRDTVPQLADKIMAAMNATGDFDVTVDTTASIDSVQKVTFDNIPDAGLFSLHYDSQNTTSILYSDTASTVQTAVRALTGLGSATVTGDFTNGFVITLVGVANPLQFSTNVNTLLTNAIQTITFSAVPDSGAFTLHYGSSNTSSLNYNATSTDVQVALQAISGLGGVTVLGDFTTGFVITMTGVSSPTAITVSASTLKIGPTNITTTVTEGPVAISYEDRTPEQFEVETAESGDSTVTVSSTPYFMYVHSGFPATSTRTQIGFGEDATNHFALLSAAISPAERIANTAKSLVKVINLNSSDYVVGYYTSQVDELPGAIELQSKQLDGISFTLKGNNTDTGRMFNSNISGNGQTATNESHPNRIYFSKYLQPEAVPTTNNIDVGPKDKKILRIIGLRDSLFILKEEGIYRLTGTTAADFTVTLFDNSAMLIAPDTAAVLNNQIYALTTLGVATISEGGVGVISRAIENIFSRVSSPDYTNFSTASFGLGYEADKSYLLFTIDKSSDTDATKTYRYNTFTQCWTSWTKSATCGIVNPSQNLLYLGAADIPAVEVERKSIKLTDYVDREYTRSLQYHNGGYILDTTANVEVGDMLLQTQYLTPSQYNILIRKLKTDPSLGFPSNYVEITAPTTDLTATLKTLAQTLTSLDTSLLSFSINTVGVVGPTFPSNPGLTDGDAIFFPSTNVNPIPTPLLADTFYFVINSSPTSFQLTTREGDATGILTGYATVSALFNGSVQYYYSSSTDLSVLQSDYNHNIRVLNNSTDVFYSDYAASSGTVDASLLATGISSAYNKVLTFNQVRFFIGDITHLKSVQSTIVWAPIALGDPSMLKHIRSGTFLMESDTMWGATVGYATDLSGNFEDILVGIHEDARWGNGIWGKVTWGGEGTSVPIRTLIPRQKQRCRYIKARFQHSNAMNKFAIVGISYTFEQGSDRAYSGERD